MNKMHLFRFFLFALVITALGISVVAAQDTPAIDEAWWQQAGQPYAGVTIHGVSESTPPSNYVREVLAPQFEALTGIHVELETTSWDQMYDKAIRDMQAGTGIYDFVYIEQDIIYGYLAQDFLTNVTQLLADNPDLASPEFSFDNFTSFLDYFKNADGDVFGVPMEAFIKTYLYRSDLFNDAEVKAAFEQEFGYPLAPATTHAQYTDIAKFFTEWGQSHDLELWGSTVQAASGHPSSFYEVFESVLPDYGVYNWGIDMTSWKASVENGGQMNSDAAKAGLAWWIDLLQYAPPEATSSTWDEVAATFAAGRAAQGLVYGENAAWIATDESRSTVVGKVGVALPPMEPGVMDAAEAGDGYIGYYDGGAFGIPVTSNNKEATMLWLEFTGLPQVQAEWAAASSRITETATFDDPIVQAMDARVDHYFTMMQDEGYLFGGAPPFPFHPQVREIVAPFIYQAIAGQLTAADALDQAAVATDAELVRLGYAS